MARQLHKQDRSACQRRMDLAGRWCLNGRGYELIDLAKSICSADQSHLAQTKENSTPVPALFACGLSDGPRIWLRFMADITKTRSFKRRAWWTTTQSHRVYANPLFHFGTEVP
jgi:hypothetical protein